MRRALAAIWETVRDGLSSILMGSSERAWHVFARLFCSGYVIVHGRLSLSPSIPLRLDSIRSPSDSLDISSDENRTECPARPAWIATAIANAVLPMLGRAATMIRSCG